MNRSLFRSPIAVCAGVMCLIGCQVYDPELLEERAQRRSIRGDERERDASAGDAAEGDAAEGCGDGVVEGDEACDIGIARGKPGACPDGCSGGGGCTRRVLEGEACQAKCVERELTEAVPDDGCCPPDTDYHDDNDCAARCGNGELEPGERCDPADTCPREEACKSTEACVSARFVGAADSCNAYCELTPITGCVGGDGCCPAGCDLERDSDCRPQCPQGQSCTGEVMPEPMQPERPPFDCNTAHQGNDCKACDCAKCGAETEACLYDVDPDDSMLCAAVIDCAERVQCAAGACYCGSAPADACRSEPLGMCRAEWNAAARLHVPALVLAAAGSASFTLGKAVDVTECRARNCAVECGLTPPPPPQ